MIWTKGIMETGQRQNGSMQGKMNKNKSEKN